MTLDELNQINVNDPAQVKALQTFLKSRGYYNGALDGKWGGGTVDGVKSLRTDLQTEAQTALRAKEVGAETARTNLEAEREKSSWGRFAQEFGPYGAGATGGLLAGYGIMRGNAAADKRLGEEAGRMITDKRIGPVVAEKTLDSRLRGRTLRAGKQMLNPAAAFGLAEVTRRYIKPNVSEEIQPYVDLAANAEQGLGGGMAVMTIKDALSSKNPVAADTEALIRSRAAEARGDPYTISGKEKAAAPAGPDPARMAELRAKKAADLRAEAKAAGLHVSGTKEDLARRIAEGQASAPAKKARIPRGKAGLLAPLAAGAIAYDAVMGEAEAGGNADVAGYATERLGQGDTLAKFEDVYNDYAKYARARGENPIPERAFRRQLTEQGIGIARAGGADRVVASLNAGEYAGKVAAEAPSRLKAGAAGAAAAGLTAGATKAAPYVASGMSKALLGRLALRAIPPAAMAMTAYDVGNYVAQSARPGPKNDAFAEQYAKTHPRVDPEALRQERMQMREAASAPPSGGGQDFDAMLADFVRSIEEHNASVGGAE